MSVKVSGPIGTAADLDGRGLGVVLAADQLVGLGDPHDVADAGHRAQVERLERRDVADQADDRALHAAADERGAARALDARDDGVDLLRGSAGAHDDDHGRPVGGLGKARAIVALSSFSWPPLGDVNEWNDASFTQRPTQPSAYPTTTRPVLSTDTSMKSSRLRSGVLEQLLSPAGMRAASTLPHQMQSRCTGSVGVASTVTQFLP